MGLILVATITELKGYSHSEAGNDELMKQEAFCLSNNTRVMVVLLGRSIYTI